MSTYTLQPSSDGQDIWITNVFSYGSNYGVDDPWLKVGGWGDYYYSLIQFNVSAAPLSASDVTSATLRLYSVPFTDYSPTGMYIDELHTSWTDDYGWYDHSLSYTNINTVSAPPTTGWVDIDITSAVRDWLAHPNSNYGLQLRPVGNNHNLDYFVSSEATGDMAPYRPELVITYGTVISASPLLDSVSPTAYPADANSHLMRLFGSSFGSGDTLTFNDPQGDIFNSVSANLTLVSSNEIDYQFYDGTDSGIWTVQVNSADGMLHSSGISFSVAPPAHIGAIQYSASHQVDFLAFSGTTLAESFLLPTPLWNVVGSGDFNQDGKLDLVTQGPEGQLDVVYLNYGTVNLTNPLYLGSFSIAATALANGNYWPVHGTGSFDTVTGVTGPALLSQDPSSGMIDLLWLQANGGLQASELLLGNYWEVCGAGDFNGDGHTEIITQSTSGQIDLLSFTGVQLTGSELLDGSYWPVVAVDDINHDGKADITVQDPSTGQIDHLFFTGTILTSSQLDTPALPGSSVINASLLLNQS